MILETNRRVWYKCPKCGDIQESEKAELLCRHVDGLYVMNRANIYVAEHRAVRTEPKP